MSLYDDDRDDRCDDEANEGLRWDQIRECCRRHGTPFDPVLEGLVETEEEDNE